MESMSTQSLNNSNDLEEIKLLTENSTNDTCENINITFINMCINKFNMIFILTISILLIFLDLYIAITINNNTCLDNYMKIYLYVSSGLILLLLSIYIFSKNIVKILIVYYHLIKIVLYTYIFIIVGFILCTILGSIIFWSIIDRKKCSYFVDKYLYITLVIKICLIFYLIYKKFFIT